MSTIDSALERAAQQWRDEVDTAYRAVAWHPPRARRPGSNWLWMGLATGTAVAAAVVVWATTSGGGGGGHHPPPQLDCAGPVLRVPGGKRVQPGQKLTVRGRFYVTGCQDSVQKTKPKPIAAVRLTLTQAGGRHVVLTTARPAGKLGTFKASIRIPRDARLGRATLRDGGVSSAAVKLTVTRD